MNNAIETTYNGITYRSRLEATWAALFTNLGWKFQYEPFDGNGYIPDFVLIGEHPLLLEVKPILSIEETVQHADKVKRGVLDIPYSIAIVGALPCLYSDTYRNGSPAGLVYQRDAWLPEYEWSHLHWVKCCHCKEIRLHTPDGWWAAYTCGCSEKHYYNIVADDEITKVWEEAKNETRWTPRTGRQG